MDLSLSQAFKAPKLMGKVFKILTDSHQKVQESRLNEFLALVDLRYDSMSQSDQEKLEESIDSYSGRELLAKYAEAIIKADSRIGRMALALIYCDDPEFSFMDSEKIVLVKAIKELDDSLLQFFLIACELDKQVEKLPYPRASFGNKTADILKQYNWDQETVFVYVNELIRLRLLVPDPKTSATVASDVETHWAVWFGITDRSLKMSRLFLKAKELLGEPKYKDALTLEN